MFSLPTRRRPLTGSLKTPVKTVFSCQGTFFGMPTLTDTNVPTDWATGRAESGDEGSERTRTRLPEPDHRQVPPRASGRGLLSCHDAHDKHMLYEGRPRQLAGT